MKKIEIGFHTVNSVKHMHMHIGFPSYVQKIGLPGKWGSKQQADVKNLWISVEDVARSKCGHAGWRMRLQPVDIQTAVTMIFDGVPAEEVVRVIEAGARARSDGAGAGARSFLQGNQAATAT